MSEFYFLIYKIIDLEILRFLLIFLFGILVVNHILSSDEFHFYYCALHIDKYWIDQVCQIGMHFGNPMLLKFVNSFSNL